KHDFKLGKDIQTGSFLLNFLCAKSFVILVVKAYPFGKNVQALIIFFFLWEILKKNQFCQKYRSKRKISISTIHNQYGRGLRGGVGLGRGHLVARLLFNLDGTRSDTGTETKENALGWTLKRVLIRRSMFRTLESKIITNLPKQQAVAGNKTKFDQSSFE
ncbi:hypothetical protein A2U01_0002410, partial [Trifolium medium]|nr:hypothetical protein [Trifolium medium]